MSDIQYWEDTLVEEMEGVAALLEKIPRMRSHADQAAALERAKARLRSATGTQRSFKMEIRLIHDVPSRRHYEARFQALDAQIRTLQADWKALENELQRTDLLKNSAKTSTYASGGDIEMGSRMDGEKAGDEILREASNVQEKTQDSLNNTRSMIAASKEVGVSTLEELERQRNVIGSIERETDRIDDNLARAEVLLKQFGRRMASDHFIQCFAVVNCLLLAGVVIFVIIKKGSLTGTPAPPQPT